MKILKICAFVFISSFVFSTFARNILVEFKGAYFLPTGNAFRKIYKGSGLYGPELTVQLWNEKNWYLFTSFDYLKTHGYSLGLHSPTSVRMYPIALGAKYFFTQWCKSVDFYAGLGFETMCVSTHTTSAGVTQKISKWGAGGRAKVGCYYYLPHNFLLDTFIDYSFMSASSTKWFDPAIGLQQRKGRVSGAIFGVGLGYTFN